MATYYCIKNEIGSSFVNIPTLIWNKRITLKLQQDNDVFVLDMQRYWETYGDENPTIGVATHYNVETKGFTYNGVTYPSIKESSEVGIFVITGVYKYYNCARDYFNLYVEVDLYDADFEEEVVNLYDKDTLSLEYQYMVFLDGYLRTETNPLCSIAYGKPNTANEGILKFKYKSDVGEINLIELRRNSSGVYYSSQEEYSQYWLDEEPILHKQQTIIIGETTSLELASAHVLTSAYYWAYQFDYGNLINMWGPSKLSQVKIDHSGYNPTILPHEIDEILFSADIYNDKIYDYIGDDAAVVIILDNGIISNIDFYPDVYVPFTPNGYLYDAQTDSLTPAEYNDEDETIELDDSYNILARSSSPYPATPFSCLAFRPKEEAQLPLNDLIKLPKEIYSIQDRTIVWNEENPLFQLLKGKTAYACSYSELSVVKVFNSSLNVLTDCYVEPNEDLYKVKDYMEFFVTRAEVSEAGWRFVDGEQTLYTGGMFPIDAIYDDDNTD